MMDILTGKFAFDVLLETLSGLNKVVVIFFLAFLISTGAIKILAEYLVAFITGITDFTKDMANILIGGIGLQGGVDESTYIAARPAMEFKGIVESFQEATEKYGWELLKYINPIYWGGAIVDKTKDIFGLNGTGVPDVPDALKDIEGGVKDLGGGLWKGVEGVYNSAGQLVIMVSPALAPSAWIDTATNIIGSVGSSTVNTVSTLVNTVSNIVSNPSGAISNTINMFTSGFNSLVNSTKSLFGW